jgi:hypothetical protein
MPHKVLQLVVTHLEGLTCVPGQEDQAIKEVCSSIAQWCYLAHDAFSINAVTEMDYEYHGKWLKQRLNTTVVLKELGPVMFVRCKR